MPSRSGAVMSVRMCCTARWNRNCVVAGRYEMRVWSTSKPIQWYDEMQNARLHPRSSHRPAGGR